MAQDKTQLQRIFDLYNRRYFGNKLKNVVVRWANKPIGSAKTHLMGQTATSVMKDGTQSCLIQISSNYKKLANVAQMTLLHEMCHAKIHQEDGFKVHHGPKFQAEMLRLAKINAFRDLW